jgi:hypothetical protein
VFAVVEKTRPSFGEIDAEIAFMRDKQYSGTERHMAVIMNIDQEMAFYRLLLNPGMENRHELLGGNRARIGNEKLDSELIDLHFR